MLFQWAWTGEKSTSKFKRENGNQYLHIKQNETELHWVQTNTKKNSEWNNQWAYEQARNRQNSCKAPVIHNQTSKQIPKQQEEKMKEQW